MTESEWLSCEDPGCLLDHIETKGSDRKFRLFAVACCRRLGHLLTDDRSRRAVEVTEQYANGLASLQVLQEATEAAERVVESEEETGEPTPATAACLIASDQPFDAAYSCGIISVLMDRDGRRNEPDWWATHEKEGEEEARHQVGLLRCIFGNPFRPVAIEPTWLTWHAGAVVKLAQAVYEERQLPSGHLDVARLAVLGDMLEESGCSNAEILAHLRSTGPHVRGCWALDLLLGKN
jgi:hypothetical protein